MRLEHDHSEEGPFWTRRSDNARLASHRSGGRRCVRGRDHFTANKRWLVSRWWHRGSVSSMLRQPGFQRSSEVVRPHRGSTRLEASGGRPRRRALRSGSGPSLRGGGFYHLRFARQLFSASPILFSGWDRRRAVRFFGPRLRGRRLLSPPSFPSTFFCAPESFFRGGASPR